MQWKLNLIWLICLWMGKTIETKPHRVNLRSPLPRIHYYQNKQLQVKWITIPNTNLQLNPYLNTQLDLQYSDNLSFQCTAPSTWLTNRCTDPSTLLTNLRKILAAKFFSSSRRWRSKSSLVTKPLAQRCSNFYKRKMN